MRPESDVRRAFELWEQGFSRLAIARTTGVSYTQVHRWVARGLDAVLQSPMRRVSSSPHDDGGQCLLVANVGGDAYAYLLGQYLGDGYIASHRRGVYRLRIATCDDYPVIREECELAMELVMPRSP